VDLRLNERRRERCEDSGTIAGAMIGRNRASVAHAMERVQGCIDDLPVRSPSGIGDEADSARIVLESGVVQARGSQNPRYRIAATSAAPQTITPKGARALVRSTQPRIYTRST
jgi:hypothetical protein